MSKRCYLDITLTHWLGVAWVKIDRPIYSHAESLKPYIHELKVLKPYFHELKVLKPYIHELKVWNPIFTSWKFETLYSQAESWTLYSQAES